MGGLKLAGDMESACLRVAKLNDLPVSSDGELFLLQRGFNGVLGLEDLVEFLELY